MGCLTRTSGGSAPGRAGADQGRLPPAAPPKSLRMPRPPQQPQRIADPRPGATGHPAGVPAPAELRCGPGPSGRQTAGLPPRQGFGRSGSLPESVGAGGRGPRHRCLCDRLSLPATDRTGPAFRVAARPVFCPALARLAGRPPALGGAGARRPAGASRPPAGPAQRNVSGAHGPAQRRGSLAEAERGAGPTGVNDRPRWCPRADRKRHPRAAPPRGSGLRTCTVRRVPSPVRRLSTEARDSVGLLPFRPCQTYSCAGIWSMVGLQPEQEMEEAACRIERSSSSRPMRGSTSV